MMNFSLADTNGEISNFDFKLFRTLFRGEDAQSPESRVLDFCSYLRLNSSIDLFEFFPVIGLDMRSDLEVEDDNLVDAIEGGFEVVGDNIGFFELVSIRSSSSGRQAACRSILSFHLSIFGAQGPEYLRKQPTYQIKLYMNKMSIYLIIFT